MKTRTLAAAVLCVTALVAGCGGTDDAKVVATEASPDFLMASADRTLAVHTARLEMTLSIDTPDLGDGVALHGTGAFDDERGAMAMELDMSDLLAAIPGEAEGLPAAAAEAFAQPMTMVRAGTVVYIRLPALAALVGGGKDWISFDAANVAGTGDGDLFGTGDGSFATDPTSLLEFLRGAGGSVDDLGRADVRGTPTTHLRGNFTMADALERVSPARRDQLEAAVGTLGAGGGDDLLHQAIPVDAYIDDQGLVRRLDRAVETSDGAIRYEVDFFDFGATVDIQVPDPSDVVDVSDQLGGLFSGG